MAESRIGRWESQQPAAGSRLRRERAVLIFAAGTAGAGLGGALHALAGSGFRSLLFLGGAVSLAGMAAVASLSTYDRARTFLVWSPVVWACVAVGVYAAVSPIALSFSSDGTFLGSDVSSGLARVGLISLLAGLGLVSGVVWRHRSPAPRVRIGRLNGSGVYFTLAVGATGYVAWILIAGVGLGDLNALSQQNSYGSFASRASGPLLDYLALFRLTLVAGGAGLMVLGIQRGSRWHSVLGLFLLAVMLLQGLRFPLVVALAAVVIAASSDGRLRRRAVVVVAGSAVVGLALIAQARSTGPIGGPAEFVSARTASAFDLNRPLAAVVESGEPLKLGSSYAYVVVQVVPRELWPEKPLPPTVEVLRRVTDPGSGFAMPLYGEMFVDFGYLGVFLGMHLVGRLCARWERAITRRGHIRPFELLAVPFIASALSRNLLVQAIYTGAFLILPAAATWGVSRVTVHMLATRKGSSRRSGGRLA